MSEALTPIDAAFLELEEQDDCSSMHIGAALIFDPLPEGGTPSAARLAELLSLRLRGLPRYGMRLSRPQVGGLTRPAWEPVPDFDVADHIRQATLPAPGGEDELTEWLGDFFSHRLDRARPLWEMTVLDGLERGRWAICTKTHHAMVDGVGSVDVAHLMLDASPEPPDAGPEPSATSASEARGSRWPAWVPAALVARGARLGLDTVLHPLSSARSVLDRSLAAGELIVKDEVIAAPHTSFNVEIGSARRYRAVEIDLDRVKSIKRSLGGTVNDVALAVCAGGLRTALAHRGEAPPERPVRAMVPVNLRGADDHSAAGNLVTTLYADLPLAIDDRRARYDAIVESTRRLKGGHAGLGSATIVDAIGLAPPAVHALMSRALIGARLFNLTITNVPGPQMTLYAFGAPMRQVYPLVPLFADHALGIAIVSYDGRMFFGLNADRATVPDLDRIRAGIEDELVALERLVAARFPLREAQAAART